MPRAHRDKYIRKNIEMCIKTFSELWLDIKICWLDVTRPGLLETCRIKIFLMLIPEKNAFSDKYVILAMLTLKSKVNVLFCYLHHCLVVDFVFTFLTDCTL